MNLAKKDGILLEAGTNEIEILEINLGAKYIGINVLKIKQIVKYDATQIHRVPGEKKEFLGTYIFKDECVPVVDLSGYFLETSAETARYNVLIICEMNQHFIGFLVNNIGRIRRITWKDIKPMPSLMNAVESQIMTIGVAVIDGKQLFMLDLEKIIDHIFPKKDPSLDAINLRLPEQLREARGKLRILLADDSGVIRTKVSYLLQKENYINVRTFENGEDLFKVITEKREKNGDISSQIDLIITDIEMPQMDGLTLCKRAKEISRDFKILVLSSMITEQIYRKCSSVGADGALSKGELNQLVSKIDQLCLPEYIPVPKAS